MKHRAIFFRLEYLLLLEGLDIKGLAEAAGMTYVTLRRKLRGEASFLLDECFAIKKALNTDMPIETLFEKR